jgi:D-glycero-D-manno-heptose 1,7-bisphosphate phosphatase
VTNQPDIGRKLLSPAVLSLMHAKLQAVLPITHIYVCPHSDEDNCLCRKPKPGLIFQAAAEHHIDCENSYLVGDRWSDIEAGRQAGCKTLFIDYGYQEQPPLNPHHQSHSLSEGISWILGEK